MIFNSKLENGILKEVAVLCASLFFVLCINVIASDAAVVCAPGDVPIAQDGTPTDAANAVDCLYGSNKVQGFSDTITDPRVNIRIGLNLALGFLGVIVVVMIIYGGTLWLTAAGNDDRVAKGKETLVWTAIGAVVISLAWTISSYVLRIGPTIAG